MNANVMDINWPQIRVQFEEKEFKFSHFSASDYIFNQMKRSGEFYEKELLNALKAFLKPGDLVVDVGANLGSHSIFFAGVCGCDVISFEPNPTMASVLRNNIQLNGLEDRITVHEVGLGSQKGKAEMFFPNQQNSGMASLKLSDDDNGAIIVDTLNNYVTDKKVRLIKIDAEGMDYDVLLGSADIIDRDKCLVSIEANGKNEYINIYNTLNKFGYVSSGSYNYTPTHIFSHTGEADTEARLSAILRQNALDYIDRAEHRDISKRNQDDINKKINSINSGIADIRALLETLVYNSVVSAEIESISSRLSIAANSSIKNHTSTYNQKKSQINKDAYVTIDIDADKLDQSLKDGAIVSTAPLRHEELVSIIMPSFNNGDWLARAMHAALSQRGVRIELIVIDDGSSDNSISVARSVASHHDNVKVISLLKNFGCYYARNIGVMNASGDYVTILDSDDIMPLDRIAIQLDAIKEGNGALACFGRLRRWTQDFAQPLSELRYGEGTLLWRRDVVDTMGPYDTTRYGADTEFRLRLQRHFGDEAIIRIPDELYYARTLETSLTASGGSRAYAVEDGALTPKLSPERQKYAENMIKWHQQGTAPRLDFPLLDRPFALGGENQNASPSLGHKRIGSMASFPPRIESLKVAVESIIPQVDELRLYLNGYDQVPSFLKHPKISVTLSKNAAGDLRDNGKFYNLPDGDDCYIFTFDDDIIYPSDYTSKLIHFIELMDRECIVGLHGVIFPSGELKSLAQRDVYHFAQKHDGHLVDLIGTGTAAWHSSTLKVPLEGFGTQGVCDLWFATSAAKRGVPLFSVPREKGWLKPHGNFDESLYQEALSQPHRFFDVYSNHLAPALKNGANRQAMKSRLAARYDQETLQAAGIAITP